MQGHSARVLGGDRRGRRSTGPRGAGSNSTRSIGPWTASPASVPHSPAARRAAVAVHSSRQPRRSASNSSASGATTQASDGVDLRHGPRGRLQAGPLGRRPPGRPGLNRGQDQQARRGRRRQQPPVPDPGQPIQRQARPPPPRPAPGSASSIRDAASTPGARASPARPGPRSARGRAPAARRSGPKSARTAPTGVNARTARNRSASLKRFELQQRRRCEQAQPDGAVVGRGPRAAARRDQVGRPGVPQQAPARASSRPRASPSSRRCRSPTKTGGSARARR